MAGQKYGAVSWSRRSSCRSWGGRLAGQPAGGSAGRPAGRGGGGWGRGRKPNWACIARPLAGQVNIIPEMDNCCGELAGRLGAAGGGQAGQNVVGWWG